MYYTVVEWGDEAYRNVTREEYENVTVDGE